MKRLKRTNKVKMLEKSNLKKKLKIRAKMTSLLRLLIMKMEPTLLNIRFNSLVKSKSMCFLRMTKVNFKKLEDHQ